MKKLFFIFAVVFLFFTNNSEARHRDGVTFNYFYSSLSPYGEWIAIDHDVYAWRPIRIHRAWSPYSDGRWVWTRHGWYWDSYEPYGWAVYHYGRWYYDDYYGWMWIPDYEWGPAWVEWRYDDVYIGWAPLSPYALFDVHVGIHFSFDWHFPHHHWNYVNYNNFCSYNVNNYFVPDKYKYRIHSRTKYRNDYHYSDGRIVNRGVSRDYVEGRAGTRIREQNIIETSRLRDNNDLRSRDRNRVEVFRPADDDIKRTKDLSSFEIKRSNRKTSLDLSKVETKNRSEIRDVERKRDQDVKINSRNDSNERNIQRNSEIRIDTKRESENGRTEKKVKIESKNSAEKPVKRQVKISTERKSNKENIQIQGKRNKPQVEEKRTVHRNTDSERKVIERRKSPKVESRSNERKAPENKERSPDKSSKDRRR